MTSLLRYNKLSYLPKNQGLTRNDKAPDESEACINSCAQQDLNLRPMDYESTALTN